MLLGCREASDARTIQGRMNTRPSTCLSRSKSATMISVQNWRVSLGVQRLHAQACKAVLKADNRSYLNQEPKW